LRATTKKGRQLLTNNVHPGDLTGGFSDLEMTWLLYCTGAATVYTARLNMQKIRTTACNRLQ